MASFKDYLQGVSDKHDKLPNIIREYGSDTVDSLPLALSIIKKDLPSKYRTLNPIFNAIMKKFSGVRFENVTARFFWVLQPTLGVDIEADIVMPEFGTTAKFKHKSINASMSSTKITHPAFSREWSFHEHPSDTVDGMHTSMALRFGKARDLVSEFKATFPNYFRDPRSEEYGHVWVNFKNSPEGLSRALQSPWVRKNFGQIDLNILYQTEWLRRNEPGYDTTLVNNKYDTRPARDLTKLSDFGDYVLSLNSNAAIGMRKYYDNDWELRINVGSMSQIRFHAVYPLRSN